MVACVRDGKASLTETLRTLRFSMSCARIQNKPVRFLNPHEKLIADLRDEIKRLAQENAVLKSSLHQSGRRLLPPSQSSPAPAGATEGGGLIAMQEDSTGEQEETRRSSEESDEKIRALEDRIRRIEALAMEPGSSLDDDESSIIQRRPSLMRATAGPQGRSKVVKKKDIKGTNQCRLLKVLSVDLGMLQGSVGLSRTRSIRKCHQRVWRSVQAGTTGLRRITVIAVNAPLRLRRI